MVSSAAVIAGEWTLFSLALSLVAARLLVRLYLNRDHLYVADIWLLVAIFSALGLLICDTLAFQTGDMANFTNPSVRLWKIRFAVSYFFDVGLYFPKFSIIAFYYTLVPPTQPRMRVALSTEPGTCKAYDSALMLRIDWSLNFVTEFLNAVFPFPIVRNLKLPKLRDKIGLGIILGLGIITVAITIARFTHMINAGAVFSNYLWTVAEICVSIMVVALTALRPLLRKISHLLNYSLNSSGYESRDIGTSTGSRFKATRSKATQSQNRTYWRNITGTQQNGAGTDDNGSEVQLNELKPGQVLKTEAIRISSESYPAEDASASGKPMGVETTIMA
ncbi:hypothetical protein N0V84_004064 [Fusarium piperis]|uniref:Rhodopsin domain-containing protein n=1 Tax=Fusarium piperis TaxID=1435070 RepID=A0A9W8WGP9_9HYPO|nr:hypothetical protein N0V84_004064 [Fusarium piperis]